MVAHVKGVEVIIVWLYLPGDDLPRHIAVTSLAMTSYQPGHTLVPSAFQARSAAAQCNNT